MTETSEQIEGYQWKKNWDVSEQIEMYQWTNWGILVNKLRETCEQIKGYWLSHFSHVKGRNRKFIIMTSLRKGKSNKITHRHFNYNCIVTKAGRTYHSFTNSHHKPVIDLTFKCILGEAKWGKESPPLYPTPFEKYTFLVDYEARHFWGQLRLIVSGIKVLASV